MSSSGSTNAQARALLQTLCNFMSPLIQMAIGKGIDLKNFSFGTEADEFVIELEKFISGMILRSQPRNQDLTIEAADEVYKEEEVIMDASSNTKRKPGDIHINDWSMLPYHAVPPAMYLVAYEEDLKGKLMILRTHVIRKMPIRMLSFEPHNSKLKITLLEREDIYNRLALKLQADFYKEPSLNGYWWVSKNARYAILSHTWTQTPGELTYGDWQKVSLDAALQKCRKLVNFCKVAWENHRLTLGWIDTVCINKESSAELDESIRSMYAWYRDAQVCITYLARTNVIQEMRNDPWFTRGWTLQELVAPSSIKFYNMDWNQLSRDSDDKWNFSILAEIEFATTIKLGELWNIRKTPISRRMQLAAKRQVTRGEDIAYCLMGIFDVSISTAYGEGADRAFFRLVEEIFRSTKDVSDIFNWAGDRAGYLREPVSSLFPSNPSNYLNRSENMQLRTWHPIEPLILTHLGLRTPILLMPALPLINISPYPSPIGDYHAAISIVPYGHSGYSLHLPEDYLLLDKRIYGPEGMYEVLLDDDFVTEMITLTFGTLSVEEQENSIHIPKTCLSVLLRQKAETSSPFYDKIHTKEPIVFDLEKTRNNPNDYKNKKYYEVERSQLANHGMQLVTVYL